MKSKLLFLGMILMNISIYGQTEKVEIGGNYYFKNYAGYANANSKLLQIGAVAAAAANFSAINAGNNYVIKVKSIDPNNNVIFEYWTFKDGATEAAINGASKINSYQLPMNEFKNMMAVYYNRIDWKVGLLTIPYKIRFSNFSFQPDVNLGANVSAKIKWSRKLENGFSLEPLLGFGISKISLDDSNSTIDKAGSVSGFTLNTGLIIHITEKVNLGVLYGFDFLDSKDNVKYNWKYNGNGWLGLGLNISLSDEGKNNSSSNSNQ